MSKITFFKKNIPLRYLTMKQRQKTVELYNNLRLRDDFIAGDNEAYSKLYRMYSPGLYAFGLFLHIKTPLIEDAIQDVFEEIYLHKHNLKNVENLKLYFMAAFRNRVFHLLKKELNFAEKIEACHVSELMEENHLDTLIEKESEEKKESLIRILLEELNTNQREVIHLRFIEGLSLDEIASLMNINYQSVKNLIYRAVKKLTKVKSATPYLLVLYISSAVMIFTV